MVASIPIGYSRAGGNKKRTQAIVVVKPRAAAIGQPPKGLRLAHAPVLEMADWLEPRVRRSGVAEAPGTVRHSIPRIFARCQRWLQRSLLLRW
jgi:hypothetical protein